MQKGVIKTVEVVKRIHVPVEWIVYRDVIKKVEKVVEVPVEKIVIKEISVPVPMKAAKNKATRMRNRRLGTSSVTG